MINTHLLQFKAGPAKYKSTLADVSLRRLPTEYWENIPTYLFAHCPICASKFSAQLDTYSLKYWGHSLGSGKKIFCNDHQEIGCKHFVLTHYFLNLNDNYPLEKEYWGNNSEVPYVIPRLLNDNPEILLPGYHTEVLDPCAVMHALPICRLENRQFVPRYSLYMITYFALNSAHMRAYYSKLRAYQEWFPQPLPSDADKELWWDLEYWVKKQKLYWLDPDDHSLSLSQHPHIFPYRQVEGIKHEVLYTKEKRIKMPKIVGDANETYLRFE